MSARTPEFDVTGAELALGLLDWEERSAAERRLATEPPIRAEFDWWAERLNGLCEDEQPLPSMWGRIAARLPANDAGSRSQPKFWRGAAIAASAAAVLLAVGLAASLNRRPQVINVVHRTVVAPRLAAVLTGDAQSGTLVAVSYDPATGGLRVAPVRLNVANGSLELWIIPADKRPRALGLVAVSDVTSRRSTLATAGLIQPGSVFAISHEPEGGSQTGAPTGPVILKGAVVRL